MTTYSGLDSDLFGDFARVSIDRSLYSDDAIFKTSYWFTDSFYLYLDAPQHGRVTVELRAKGPTTAEALERACSEFCNSLIDFRVRQIVLAETIPIREALILKAFAEGVSTPGLAGAVSNESHLLNSK